MRHFERFQHPHCNWLSADVYGHGAQIWIFGIYRVCGSMAWGWRPDANSMHKNKSGSRWLRIKIVIAWKALFHKWYRKNMAVDLLQKYSTPFLDILRHNQISCKHIWVIYTEMVYPALSQLVNNNFKPAFHILLKEYLAHQPTKKLKQENLWEVKYFIRNAFLQFRSLTISHIVFAFENVPFINAPYPASYNKRRF